MVYIVQLLLFLCVAWVLWQHRQQKKLQEALVKPLRGKRFWRINLSRPSHHARLWRLSVFEATGVLIDEGAKVRVLGFRLMYGPDTWWTDVRGQGGHLWSYWPQETTPCPGAPETP